jgi:hypothetical protein
MSSLGVGLFRAAPGPLCVAPGAGDLYVSQRGDDAHTVNTCSLATGAVFTRLKLSILPVDRSPPLAPRARCRRPKDSRYELRQQHWSRLATVSWANALTDCERAASSRLPDRPFRRALARGNPRRAQENPCATENCRLHAVAIILLASAVVPGSAAGPVPEQLDQ